MLAGDHMIWLCGMENFNKLRPVLIDVSGFIIGIVVGLGIST
jgi:hypothetical protein